MNAPANPFGYLPVSRIKSRDKTPCALRIAPPQGANRRRFIQGATRTVASARQRNKTPYALRTAPPQGANRRQFIQGATRAFASAEQRNKTPCALSTPPTGPEAPLRRNRAEWKSDAKTPCALRNTASTAHP